MTAADGSDELNRVLLDFVASEFVDDATIDLRADTELLVSGLLDSLAVMRLVVFVESEFGISVPPQDVTIDNFVDVQSVTNYASRQLREQ